MWLTHNFRIALKNHIKIIALQFPKCFIYMEKTGRTFKRRNWGMKKVVLLSMMFFAFFLLDSYSLILHYIHGRHI